MKLEAAFRLLADVEGPLAATDYWKKRGAGCIVGARSTGRILLQLRGPEVSDPNTWGTWGGSVDAAEDPSTTCRRELAEEAGYYDAVDLYPLLHYRNLDTGNSYQNFLAVVADEFVPVLNWESRAAQWFEFGNWPNPLHPGLETLLQDVHSVQTIRHYLK